MTIFALEQAVSNGCQLDITEADSALEEVAALRDEHERLKNDAAIFYEAATSLLATNDALRAQLAEAKRDADRWRWLRDHARIFRQSPDMSGNHYWMVQTTTTLRGPTLDAAIDAAKGERE